MTDRKPNLLITGAAGLLGSSLVRHFKNDYNVLAFDINSAEKLPSDVTFYQVDLTSENSIVEALASVRENWGTQIASVLHLAAYYDFSGEPSDLYQEVTVLGTDRLLRALQLFDVEQFVFSSTMLVHAPCEPGQKIDENWPLEPKWDYPKSKVATEEVIEARHGRIPAVVLRVAGIYDDDCNSIPIAHQIQRIHERRLTGHLYSGDLACGQSFLHRKDFIEALDRVVQRRQQLPDWSVMLLGEPETMAYGDMQNELGKLIHGSEWTTLTVPKPIAKAGSWVQEQTSSDKDKPFIKPWMIDMADDHFELDISRARSLLGWQPRHRLEDALPIMIEHMKRDPEAWYEENGIEPAESVRSPSSAR